MKTISVRDAAAALGITQRAVLYRREKGQLKGQLIKNEKGVPEYRIYPNKEIIEGLHKIASPLVSSSGMIQDADIIEAIDIQTNFAPRSDEEFEAGVLQEKAQSDWNQQQAAASGLADELWNKLMSRFVEKLEEKDQLIGEMRSEIAEKERQLRLLPDLQKQAEVERHAAELKVLEVEALKKQISAVEEQRQSIEAKTTSEVEALKNQIAAMESDSSKAAEENEQAWKQQIATLKAQQEAAIDQERKAAEEASRKAEQLNAEIERIKSQKESESKAIQEQLAALSAQLQELKQPKLSWWQKWFAPGGE